MYSTRSTNESTLAKSSVDSAKHRPERDAVVSSDGDFVHRVHARRAHGVHRVLAVARVIQFHARARVVRAPALERRRALKYFTNRVRRVDQFRLYLAVRMFVPLQEQPHLDAHQAIIVVRQHTLLLLLTQIDLPNLT